MFKLGKENIDKVYLGKSPVQKMYLGKTLIFPNEEAAECYAITPSIAQYDGDYPWVWAEDVQKWYRLNNRDEYEPYGIYGDSLEPDRIETFDYYDCAFNGGSYYEVVSSQTSGVNYYMKVEFTTPESITDQSFLFGTRLFIASAFAAGLFPEGDTGIVLKAHFGPTTAPITVGELQPSTKYVGEFQIVKTDTTARTATYTIYNEVGEVVYSGEKTGVLFSGTTFNMAIGTYSTGSTFPATVYLPYRGEMSRFTIKKSSTAIADNYNWEDVCDVVFTDENGTIYPVNLYSTGVSIRSGANNTATLTDKAGEIKTIIARGESTYKGKLSIVDGTEYEWDGNRWVNLGEVYAYEPTIVNNNFPQSGTYEEYTAYSADGATVREYKATYPTDGIVTVFCQLKLNSASSTFTANTWLSVYVNDVLQYSFQKNTTGTADLSFSINYKAGDTIKLRGRRYSTSTTTNMKFSISRLDYKDKYYEPREAPENPLVFNTIEEMEAYTCLFNGAVAVVGSNIYVYGNDNWSPLDYSKVIRYQTSDNKPLTRKIAGSLSNVMVNAIGYYIFDTVPTSIGDNVFKGQTTLRIIDLPEGITSINTGAFSGCTNLRELTVPETISSIGNYAFDSCESLTAITIPEAVTSIGGYAFRNCPRISSVTIPEGVTSIITGTFSGCSNLTSVTMGNSVTSIGDSAFSNCGRISSIGPKGSGASLGIPNSVTSIGNSAFNNCNKLISVRIPDSVTSIGASAFYNCSQLTGVTIGDNITSIGSTAFARGTNLQSLIFTNAGRLNTIGASAFQECSKLAVLRVPHIDMDFNISFSTAFTREALVAIIDDLEEPETGAHTLTMGETNLAKLTDEDISKALSNRWILQ